MAATQIDFVIPWVNSKDPEWRRKRDMLIGNHTNESAEYTGEERFRDYGTLKFLFRSIAKNAPWVHHIYLVTDNQIPSWLDSTKVNKHSQVSIIDHRAIIPSKFLPTFNSNVIELNISNISGLAEHFVLFNDDLIVNAPVQPQDFFDGDLPRDFRLYTPLKPFSDYDHTLFNNSQLINHWLQGKYLSRKGLFSHQYGHQLTKNLYHVYLERGHQVSSYVLSHNAQSFTLNNFREALNRWQIPINSMMGNHFRENSDLSTLLIRDYQLETGRFSVRSPRFSKFYTLADIEGLDDELRDKKHPLICLNDAEVENYDEQAQKAQSILERAFPERSEWEREV